MRGNGCSPAVAIVDGLVQDLHAGDIDTRHAIATLRARGYTPDGIALGDAVVALGLRDRFLARDGDPYDYLGTQPGAGRNVWDSAVEKAETDYSYAVGVLSKRVQVAS